jgi:glycosyltransferase involved in cell wall biosynthesis
MTAIQQVHVHIHPVRLAIVCTHPIQYYAPLFRQLAQEPGIELKVFYTWSEARAGILYDVEFGRNIQWDIPLLDGYGYEFVENHSKEPGLHHFKGLDNPGLIQSIRGWKPAAILIIGWNYKSHLACMRYFKKRVPVLFKGDSTLMDERPGIKKILRRIFLTWIYHYVDYALYAGKENLAYFRALGLKESQLEFVPHAIDNERFANEAGNFDQEAAKWRLALGIAKTDLVLLFAGKLEPKKDPDCMLRLAAAVPSADIKFVIVGNGKLQDELRAKAKTDSRILFLDFQNQQQMPLVYRLGDIFVLPSRGPGETWGLALNEAMASGRPILVSDRVGGGSDLVEENRTGWLFKPGLEGDEKIAGLIKRILAGRGTLEKMGSQAREKVAQYSYSMAINNIKKVLEIIQD